MRVTVPLVVALFLCAAPSGTAQTPSQHEHAGAPPERLGTVHFDTSCATAVTAEFDRAVALLHSFWFRAAIDAFTAVTARDPACGMAYWGIALSQWGNPFGGFRSPQALAAGREAAAKGLAATGLSARERGYLTAVAELYRDYETVDQRTRALAYETQMDTLSRANAGDTEAAIFHALALTQTALPARQVVSEPAGRRRDPRAALQGTARSSGHRPLSDSQLRRPRTGPQGARRRNALRDDRAVGAARAAHALAHLHAGRALAGLHRHQPGVGQGGPARQVGDRGAAREGLPGLRVPADRSGPGCPRRDRAAARAGVADRVRTCQRGAAGRWLLCARGHSRALRAGTRRLG